MWFALGGGIGATALVALLVLAPVVSLVAGSAGAEWFVDVPVGRIGVPEDIANAVSFFCSEASGFVNGQVLYVAGGPKA